MAASAFSGSLGIWVTVALAFGAVFVLAYMVGGVGMRVRRDRDLARRMAGGARAPGPSDPASEVAAAWMPASLVSAGSRVASAGGFTAALDVWLDRAGLPLRAGEFVAITAAAGIGGAVVAGIFLRNLIFMLALAALATIVPGALVSVAALRRRTRMHDQLADILMILASSLRAGHSFLQALDMVSKEVGEPSATEFSRLVAEIRLGRPVDEAMVAMAERVGSNDLKWAVLAVNIQREVGGNLAEVLDTVAETVRERDWIRRQVDVLAAEGKMSIGVLLFLPFAIGTYISVVNPGYLGLLFTRALGVAMVVVASLLMVGGFFWMRKIVKIDV